MSRAISAGLASITLRLDSNPLTRELRAITNQFRSFGRELDAIGRNLLSLGLIGGIGAGFAVQRFAKLEDALLTIQGVSRATVTEFGRVEQAVLAAGRETSFTGLQVGEAFVSLVRGGQTANRAIASIRPTLDLARGTATDLETTVRGVISTLAQFDIPASDVRRVVDGLAVAANSGAQELTDLLEALKFVGREGAEIGETFEDVAASLAVLANAGVRGTLAGTQLRRAYRNLADEGKRRNLVETLGLTEFVDESGDFRGTVAELLREVGQASKELGRIERVDLFSKIFGRGSPAALALARTPVEEVNRIFGAVNNASGEAERLAKLMDSQLGGAIRLTISAVEALGFAFGQAVEPEVVKALRAVRTVVVGMEQLIRANREVAVGSAAVVAGLLTAGTAAIGLATALKLAAFTGAQLSRVYSLVVAPIGAVTVGLGLLVSGATRAYQGLRRLVQIVISLRLVSRLASTTVRILTTTFFAFQQAVLALTTIELVLRTVASAAFRAAVNAATLLQFIGGNLTLVQKSLLVMVAAFRGAIEASSLFARAIGNVAVAFTSVGNAVTTTASSIVATVTSGIAGLVNLVVTVIPLILTTAATFVLLGTVVSFVASSLLAFTASLRSFVAGVPAVLARLGDFFRDGLDPVKDELGELTKLLFRVKSIAINAFAGIVQAVKDGEIGLAINILQTGMVAAFQQIRKEVINLYGPALAAAVKGFASFAGQITETFYDLPRLFNLFLAQMDQLVAKAGIFAELLKGPFADTKKLDAFAADFGRAFLRAVILKAEPAKRGARDQGDIVRDAILRFGEIIAAANQPDAAARDAREALKRFNFFVNAAADGLGPVIRNWEEAGNAAGRLVARFNNLEEYTSGRLLNDLVNPIVGLFGDVQDAVERAQQPVPPQLVRRTDQFEPTFDLALSRLKFGPTQELDQQLLAVNEEQLGVQKQTLVAVKKIKGGVAVGAA